MDADGTIYFGSRDCHLYALNPDGSPRWEFEATDFVNGHPCIGPDGTIYFGSRDGHFCALGVNGYTPQLADTPWPMNCHDQSRAGRFGAPLMP